MELEFFRLAVFFAGGAILGYLGSFAFKLYDKNKKGIEVVKKTNKLKNYLRDYTLLQEKDYDYINLVDKYVPYALALGEARKIENLYIEDNNFIKDILIEDVSTL